MFKLFKINPSLSIQLKTTITTPTGHEEPIFMMASKPGPSFHGCYVLEIRERPFLKDESFSYRLYHQDSGIPILLGHITVYDRAKWDPSLFLQYMKASKAVDNYKKIGTALHEVAFRVSLQLGKNGFVTLQSAYSSLLFHYGCGFRVLDQLYYHDNGKVMKIKVAPPFDWKLMDSKFKAHPEFGCRAFVKWKFNLTESETLSMPDDEVDRHLSEASFNDVLEFYYELDKKAANQEIRMFIRDNLAEQSGVEVLLDRDTVEAKKLAFGIEPKEPVFETPSVLI